MIVKVKVAQSYLTLCDSTDYTVCGILQARILKWVAFLFSRESSQPRDRTQVSHIALEFNESLSNLDVPPPKICFSTRFTCFHINIITYIVVIVKNVLSFCSFLLFESYIFFKFLPHPMKAFLNS